MLRAISVTMYMDESGIFHPDGVAKVIDCNFSMISQDYINPAVGSGNCSTIQPGTIWGNGGIAPADVTVVDTVLLNTPKGNIRIATANYASLKAACAACCV